MRGEKSQTNQLACGNTSVIDIVRVTCVGSAGLTPGGVNLLNQMSRIIPWGMCGRFNKPHLHSYDETTFLHNGNTKNFYSHLNKFYWTKRQVETNGSVNHPDSLRDYHYMVLPQTFTISFFHNAKQSFKSYLYGIILRCLFYR